MRRLSVQGLEESVMLKSNWSNNSIAKDSFASPVADRKKHHEKKLSMPAKGFFCGPPYDGSGYKRTLLHFLIMAYYMFYYLYKKSNKFPVVISISCLHFRAKVLISFGCDFHVLAEITSEEMRDGGWASGNSLSLALEGQRFVSYGCFDELLLLSLLACTWDITRYPPLPLLLESSVCT